MEMISDELTTVKWSRKYYTPSELAEKRKSFPIIVKIAESAQGNRLNEDYSTGQVLYLHSVKEQLRFLAYDEKANEFSIPINSDIGLESADIQEESSVLLHEDLELPLRVKVNSNQHTRLPDLMLEEKNLTIKQKDLMKYLMGTCISEDAGIKKTIECIPTECSNLSLQVPLMIGDGTDDRLTLFEEHVQDVVHSVIDESTFNSYQGNPDTIVNVKPIEIEESSNAPDTKINQAKGKKKRFRFKYKKIMNIQKNPKKCTSQTQDDECNQVEKRDGRPKGKRKNVKKYTRNLDKGSNIIGEKSQNTDHSYEKEIYLKKTLSEKKHYVEYEEVYEGSYKGVDDYEDVLEIQHEEEEGNSYNDEDYENKIYIQKDLTGTTTDVGGDDSEYEDIDIQKDPKERNTHEESNKDTYIDDDGYLEATEIHKGRRKMTTNTNSESDGYEDINDTSGITTDEEDNISYREDDGYEDVTDIQKGPREMTADEEGNNDTYREDDGYEDVDEEGNNDTYREDDGYEDVIDNSEDNGEMTADEEDNNDTCTDDDGYEDVDEEGNNDTCTDDDGYEDVDEEGNNDTYREDDGYEDLIDNSEDPSEITADEEDNISYREDDAYEDVIDIPMVPIDADEEGNGSNKDDEYLEVTDFSEDSHEDDDAYDYDKIDYQQLNKTNKSSKKDILPKLPPRNTPEEHRIRTNEDLPDNLSEMSCNQVQDCLKLLKLDKHLEEFQRIGVDGELLMGLNPNIMKTELNLTKFEILKLKMFVTEKWLPRV